MFVNVERLQQKMDADGLDGLVATTLGNVFYFTGIVADGLRLFHYEHQSYALVTRQAVTRPSLVVSQGLTSQIWSAECELQDVFTYGTFFRPGPFLDVALDPAEQRLKDVMDQKPAATPLDALVQALQKMGLADKKVGIDELNFKPGYWEALQERLPHARFVPVSKLLRSVRKVKTPFEVERLRKVTHITENAVIAALGIARPEVTEYEMVCEFDRSIVSQGARPYFSLIRFGRHAIAGEAEPARIPLRPGEPIWFDVGCFYGGYWADIARIACLGQPTERMVSIYRAMLAGEQAALENTKAGMTGGELFDLTMAASRAAGLPHYQRHHVGHGIGAELYEDVLISPGVSEVIEAGTVVNIETPYYEFGLGALHVEDPFVVRAGGNELLTTLSRELLIVD